MTRIIIFLAFVLIVRGTTCRGQAADSIFQRIYQNQDNNSKINALAAATNSLANSNPVEAVKLAKIIISLSTKLNDTKGKAIGYNELGNAFERYSIYDSAFYYFFIGHHLFSELHDSKGRKSTFINIGNTHEIMGRYDSAGYYAFSALAIIDSTDDPDLKAKNLRVIGNIMHKTERHEEAVGYYSEALRLLQLRDDMPELKGRVYENLALTYIKLSRYDSAEQCFAKASNIYKKTADPRAVARLNLNLAALRQLQGKYEEAIERTQFALRFYQKINHANGIGECYLTLAETYFRMRNFHSASEYAQKAIEAVHFRRDMDLQMSAYSILQKIYFETGNYKRAYEYQSAASLLHDSILSEKKAAVITEMQNRLQIQTKENEIKLLDKDNKIKSLTVRRQNVLRNSLIIVIALIVIISVLLIYQYRVSARRKHQQERRRISSDLHDEVGSSLSKITLLSQVLKKEINDAHSIAELEKISEAATDALEKMSELVWSLNPRNDRLGNLLSYIRKYAVEYFEPTTIPCKVDMPDEIPDKSINGEQRRNIFLCVKEALHNIIKHADANHVGITFSISRDRLTITIHDNGKGINSAAATGFGNGMLNMKQRMDDVGGVFSIQNENGTRVTLELSLHHTATGL